VESQALAFQALIAIPITAGLLVYTYARPNRAPLHVWVTALFGFVVVWMSCMMAGRIVPWDGALRQWLHHGEMAAVIATPALFLVTVGYFVRSPYLERNRGAQLALAAVFALLLLVYLSDPIHHLFFADREAALRGEHPTIWAGPGFWAFQTCALICDTAALSLVIAMAWRGRTANERYSALMVLGAVLVPIFAHLVFLSGIQPFDFSLAPGSLGLSAIFFVQGVTRYGFLAGQPIVRQDVIDHLDDGIILADPNGHVLDANVASEALLGCSRAEMLGHSLGDVLRRIDCDCAERGSALGEVISSLPLEGGRFQDELGTPDGRSLEITAGAVSAIGSQPGGRFVSLRDRTVQRRNEQLLQERQKLESVGILAAGIAHEVNNPLAYVRSNLLHLLDVASDASKWLEGTPAAAELHQLPDVLQESVEGIDRIASIVEGMLRYSRTPEEHVTPVAVNDLVDDALRLGALHRNSGVAVDQHLGDGLPEILGSAQRLVQVILNLLINAKQAFGDEPSGRIVVSTARDDAHVAVRIEDNGPGIRAEDRSRIFDPFFTTRPPGEGTGLGLAIAYDIVREHGGTLEYEPGRERGSCFTVRLPIPEAIRA
jgi:signal transduction histidine kinase